MAKLIGTAGHVDHGKTALIRALTGIDADRLPEEKRRGLTIDIGFAWLDLPKVGRVSIVDVPGHERFLTNMLVGALGIDVALLCVAADESVMPQTREHFQILELLPVDRMVVALTRADLADETSRAIAAEEVAGLLSGTRFAGSPVIPASAITGEGLETLRSALIDALGEPEGVQRRDWYLPVDRVFTVKGHGAVVTGTLAQGVVHEGDVAEVMPGRRQVRVRSIQSHDEARTSSEKGTRTALNLAGIKAEELHRGQAIGTPGVLFESAVVDAKVRWLGEPKHGARVRVSVGAAEAIARQFLSDADPETVQLRLESPVAVALGQPLIIRRYSPPDLIGGGRVVVPQAKARRRSAPVAATAGEADDDETRIERLVGSSRDGMPTDEVCRVLGRSPQSLGDTFEKLKTSGRLLGFAGWWMTPETYEDCAGRLLEALMALHRETPTHVLLPREPAVARAGLQWRGKPLDRILARLAEQGRLRQSGTAIGHPDHQAQLNPRQRELLDRVKAEFERAGLNVPGEKEVAEALRVPPQAVSQILRVGMESGELVRVAEGLIYAKSQLDALASWVRESLGGKPFTASEFRERAGTTRKYAIPLLEYLDAKGVTVRRGDTRSLA